ncbi:MAG: hypothetical protein AB1633_12095, partial [Elusimicrobiota bacterium]
LACKQKHDLKADIYNLDGKLVKNLYVCGTHGVEAMTMIWDGKDNQGKPVHQGAYIAIIKTGNSSASKKINLTR